MPRRPAVIALELSETEVAWLAGLLEGEGCFTPHKTVFKRSYGRAIYYQVRVSLQMTDRDIIRRVARLLEVNMNGPYDNNRKARGYSTPKSLPLWSVAVVGAKAEFISRLILPFMGKRRAARIRAGLRLRAKGTHRLT